MSGPGDPEWERRRAVIRGETPKSGPAAAKQVSVATESGGNANPPADEGQPANDRQSSGEEEAEVGRDPRKRPD